MDGRLERQLEFLAEIDKMKSIIRRTPLVDNSRLENDAEHSWHLAMLLLVLHEYAVEAPDLMGAVRLALVHDLVEIYAGDTFAYDERGYEDKAQREQDAAARLFGMLPQEQGAAMRALWDEFEACETPEARFANAGDRLQPFMNNCLSGAGPWGPAGLGKTRVLQRQQLLKEVMPALWPYVQQMADAAVRAGRLKPE